MLRRHAWPLAVGFFFMILQNYAFSRVPIYFQVLLDELIGANRPPAVQRAVLLALAFTLLTGAGMFLMRKMIIGVSRKIEYELRDRLYRKLLDLDFTFYQTRQTGDLISRCTNDLEHVRTLLGPGIMYIPDSLSRLALFIPILVAIHPRMSAISAGIMLLLVVMVAVIMPRLRPKFRQVQQLVGTINDRAWQLITGINTVKLYTMEPVETRRFEELNRRFIKANMVVARWRGVLWPTLMFLFGLTQLVILAVGGSAVINGEISIGQLLQFNAMIGVLTFPVLSLGWIMSLLQQGISAMERVRLILDHPVEIRDLSDPADGAESGLPQSTTSQNERARPPATVQGEGIAYSVRQVSYRYPNAAGDALKGVSIDIQPGETLGVTGGVGSGKSTFVALLTGIVRPTAGALLVDGADIASMDLRELKRRVAVVPQETFLFSRTVAQNIAMGTEEETGLEDVRRVTRAAAVAEDIEAFPDGYEQLVGERGLTLSGGQKQRVAIARALIKQGGALVLDDALSSVDSDTETRIIANLRELLGTRTIVIVSHRVSALKLADRVAVFEDGAISQLGTHAELLATEGGYAHMAKLQQLQEVLG